MLPPNKGEGDVQEKTSPSVQSSTPTEHNTAARAALSRNLGRVRVQTPPLIALYIMNAQFELCAVECRDGLNRLRLRAVWDGPGSGELYTLDTVRKDGRYVGRLNIVDWWLRQPKRREATEFTRSLPVRP